MIDRFPLQPKDIEIETGIPSIDGPRVSSNAPQRLVNSAGLWRLRYVEIPVFDQTVGNVDRRILTMRAMMARGQGGLNPFLVSPYDGVRSPRARAGLPPAHASVPWSGGAAWGDGSKWASSLVDCVVAVAMAQEATSGIVASIGGAPPQAGDFFSLGKGDSQRLYLLASVQPVAGGLAIKFWPKLRAPAAVNDQVELDDPLCPMTAEDGLTKLMLKNGRRGPVTIQWEETAW